MGAQQKRDIIMVTMQIFTMGGDKLVLDTTEINANRIVSQFTKFMNDGEQTQKKFAVGIEESDYDTLVLDCAKIAAIHVYK